MLCLRLQQHGVHHVLALRKLSRCCHPRPLTHAARELLPLALVDIACEVGLDRLRDAADPLAVGAAAAEGEDAVAAVLDEQRGSREAVNQVGAQPVGNDIAGILRRMQLR